jgi:hypothetical protein
MAMLVAKMQGPTISVGLAEPKDSRTPIMVAGIKVIQEVFNARNVHMAGEASSELLLRVLHLLHGFHAKGSSSIAQT